MATTPKQTADLDQAVDSALDEELDIDFDLDASDVEDIDLDLGDSLDDFEARIDAAAGEIASARVVGTTETGLVIALPGLFLQYHLARQFERYKAFLAHVESVCAQELYRAMKSVRAAA